MNTFWEAIGQWPVRALVAGGAVLLVGRLVVMLTSQPARRAWVGTASVVAALVAIPLSLIPGWVPLPVTTDLAVTTRRTIDVESRSEMSLTPTSEPRVDEHVAALSAPQRFDPPPQPRSPDLTVEKAPQRAVTSNEASAGQVTGASGRAATGAPTTDWSALGVSVYGLIVAGFLVRLAAGHFVLAQLWRKARPVPDWAEAVFRRLAGPVCPRAELRVSARPVGPVCFGIIRPRVLIPGGLLAAGDGPALRAVYAHELAHLGRRDPLAGWLLGLARSAYFICPWVTGLRREVRLAQECLADADAARQAAGPADYAELLIRLARSRPVPLGAAGVRGPSSELYRRVTMLLQSSDGVERHCPRRWALAAGAGLTALAILTAGLSIQPRSATAAEPDKAEPPKKDADKKDPEKKEPAKKDPRVDALKEALDKLKKDLKDDPTAIKLLEDLLREGQRPNPLPPGEDGRVPPRGADPRLPLPPLAPGIERLDPEKELELAQDILRQQLEMLQKQLQGGAGIRGGGFVLGPDGGVRPIPGFGSNRGGSRLGVRVERPTEVLSSQLDLPPGQGLVCVDVPAESVAGKAGIKPNDILLELAGKPVSSNFPDFHKVLADVKPDTAVDIVVMRKGKKETVKGVKLPEARPFADFPALPEFPGLQFPPVADPRALPDPIGRRAGVVVGPGETARVEQVNDAFTVFYSKGNVKVTIAGTKEGGTAKAESIEVDDNGKTHKAESIDKLPKEYQDMAKNALKAVK